MNNKFPRATQLHNIKPINRVCCKCGKEITGRPQTVVLALIHGKYLCAQCEEDRRNIQEYGVKDQDLIERIKKYSMDVEGSR